MSINSQTHTTLRIESPTFAVFAEEFLRYIRSLVPDTYLILYELILILHPNPFNIDTFGNSSLQIQNFLLNQLPKMHPIEFNSQ